MHTVGSRASASTPEPLEKQSLRCRRTRAERAVSPVLASSTLDETASRLKYGQIGSRGTVTMVTRETCSVGLAETLETLDRTPGSPLSLCLSSAEVESYRGRPRWPAHRHEVHALRSALCLGVLDTSDFEPGPTLFTLGHSHPPAVGVNNFLDDP